MDRVDVNSGGGRVGFEKAHVETGALELTVPFVVTYHTSLVSLGSLLGQQRHVFQIKLYDTTA